MATKPLPTKINQPLSFFHDHSMVTSNPGIFLQPWQPMKELRACVLGQPLTRNTWASLRLLQGQTEALTQQHEQAHIRPHPVSNYCRDYKAFRTVSSAVFLLAMNSLRRNRARRYGCSCSTSISQEPLLSAWVLPHQADQPKRKMKVSEDLTATLLFCF